MTAGAVRPTSGVRSGGSLRGALQGVCALILHHTLKGLAEWRGSIALSLIATALLPYALSTTFSALRTADAFINTRVAGEDALRERFRRAFRARDDELTNDEKAGGAPAAAGLRAVMQQRLAASRAKERQSAAGHPSLWTPSLRVVVAPFVTVSLLTVIFCANPSNDLTCPPHILFR